MEMTYKNPYKVAVLLSVYNGDTYLNDLLVSLGNQTFKDVMYYIRDDGSKDQSAVIIRSFSNAKDNVTVIKDENNLGSKKSFLTMMALIDSDYYMFCDQDDVWLPNKVELSYNAITSIEDEHPNCPVVVHTDLRPVNKDLTVIADSYWRHANISYGISHDFGMLCHFNDITGCAMIFNKAAKISAMPFIDLDMPSYVHHDYLVGLAVAKDNGIISPLNIPTILFRRHGDNQTDPLKKSPSILFMPTKIIGYCKEEYKRYNFYQNFRQCSLVQFVVNKIKTKYFQTKWIRKHA